MEPTLRDAADGIVALDCPVCPHRNITTETCPQCGANLLPIARLDSLPRQYLAEGSRQLIDGHAGQAIEFFGAAAALDPTSAAAHASLGEAYAAKGWFDEATYQFERALSLAPNDAALRDRYDRATHTQLGHSSVAKREVSQIRRLRVLVWALPVAALSLGGVVGMNILRRPQAPESIRVHSGSPAEVEAALNGVESLRGIRLAVTEHAGIVEVAGDVPSSVHIALIREVTSRVAGDQISLAALKVGVSSIPQNEVSYVVRSGDSFWSIAIARYGSGALWQHVWEANRASVPRPEALSIGQRIVLPSFTLVPR